MNAKGEEMADNVKEFTDGNFTDEVINSELPVLVDFWAVWCMPCKMVAPVVAEIAKELGVLTVAVVTRPFPFEGRKRAVVADAGIKELKEYVDSLIVVPNEKLVSVLGKDTSLLDAFKAADDVLFSAVQGISELITNPGLINVDFADVRTVMSEMGMAMMGTGSATGEKRAAEAAEMAISSPLLEDIDIAGAKGVLVNITAGMDMSIGEFEEVGEVIKGFTSDDATVVVGTVIDPEMSEDLKVTVVATGLGKTAFDTKTETVLKSSTRPDGSYDYDNLDRPTIMRKQTKSQPVNKLSKDNSELDYLDIPAFLRRQAEE